jgi:hypothetical protein
MHSTQPPYCEAVLDRSWARARCQQLSPANNSVLPSRQLRDLHIQMLGRRLAGR